MKIYQFPHPAQAPASKNKEAPGTGGGAFAEALKNAAPPSAGSRVISMENLRARQLPPPTDLGAAEQLLNQLDDKIRRSSPEFLKSLHKLDGLVCVWQA